MLSATLQRGLGEYEIGAKIRALRLKKKIGLVELGKHTGLSPALLSEVERGRLRPTQRRTHVGRHRRDGGVIPIGARAFRPAASLPPG
jgi:hypothetical protein